MIGKFI